MIRYPKVVEFDLEVNNASRVDQLTKLSSMGLIDGDCVHTRALGIGIWKNNRFLPDANLFDLEITKKYRNCFEAFAEVVEYLSKIRSCAVSLPTNDEGLLQIVPDFDSRWHSVNWRITKIYGKFHPPNESLEIAFARICGIHEDRETICLKTAEGRKIPRDHNNSMRNVFVRRFYHKKSMLLLSDVYISQETEDEFVMRVWTMLNKTTFRNTCFPCRTISLDGEKIDCSEMYVFLVLDDFETIDALVGMIKSTTSKHLQLLETSDEHQYAVFTPGESVVLKRIRLYQLVYNEEMFWKKPSSLSVYSQEAHLSAFSAYWCRRTILDACICFPHLPPYVMLEILDWLGEVTHMAHVLKIAFLQNIWRSTRKVFEARTEKELKAQKTE